MQHSHTCDSRLFNCSVDNVFADLPIDGMLVMVFFVFVFKAVDFSVSRFIFITLRNTNI